MKKKSKRIPRSEYVGVVVDARSTGRIETTVNFDTGGVTFSDAENGTGYHSRMYQGENKMRLLSHISGGEELNFSQERYMFESFDRIYFIDTNDSVFNGKKSCCTAVFEVVGHKQALTASHANMAVDVKFIVGYYIFDVAYDVSGEIIGWHLFIENIKPFITALQESKKKILLVTDHALGDHAMLNKREMPYYGKHYLPSNVTLGYAKSDKGESFAEKGLRVADQMSNKIKNSIKLRENEHITIMILKEAPWFRGFISIHPTSQL